MVVIYLDVVKNRRFWRRLVGQATSQKFLHQAQQSHIIKSNYRFKSFHSDISLSRFLFFKVFPAEIDTHYVPKMQQKYSVQNHLLMPFCNVVVRELQLYRHKPSKFCNFQLFVYCFNYLCYFSIEGYLGYFSNFSAIKGNFLIFYKIYKAQELQAQTLYAKKTVE